MSNRSSETTRTARYAETLDGIPRPPAACRLEAMRRRRRFRIRTVGFKAGTRIVGPVSGFFIRKFEKEPRR